MPTAIGLHQQLLPLDQKPAALYGINTDVPQFQGLRGFFPFLEGDGFLTSDYARQTVNFGMLNSLARWTPGRFGKCLGFTSGSKVDFGNSKAFSEITQSVTISLWLYTATAGAAGVYPRAVSKLQSTGGFNGFEFLRSATDAGGGLWPDAMYLQLAKTGTLISASETSPIVLGAWTHYAASYNYATGQIRIYKNGMLTNIHARTASMNNISTHNFYIGGHGTFDASSSWLGKLDLVAVWNRVLPDSEVAQMYQKPLLLLHGATGASRLISYVTAPSGPSLPSTGLTIHLNASDADKLFTTYSASGVHTGVPEDGARIEVWDDEGDGIADVSWRQTTVAVGPVWRSSTPLMVLPCIDFDGDDFLAFRNQVGDVARILSSIITASDFTVLIAFYLEAVTATGSNLWLNEALIADFDGYWGVYTKLTAGNPVVYGYIWDIGQRSIEFPCTLDASHVLLFRRSSATGRIYVSLDGGAESSLIAGVVQSMASTVNIGKGTATAFNGRIGEIAIYNTDKSATGGHLDYFLDRWLVPETYTATAALSVGSFVSAFAAFVGIYTTTSPLSAGEVTLAASATVAPGTHTAVAALPVAAAAFTSSANLGGVVVPDYRAVRSALSALERKRQRNLQLCYL